MHDPSELVARFASASIVRAGHHSPNHHTTPTRAAKPASVDRAVRKPVMMLAPAIAAHRHGQQCDMQGQFLKRNRVQTSPCPKLLPMYGEQSFSCVGRNR